MPTAKKILHLKILFDTNVIFNGSSSNLLTNEITEIIEKYSNPADLKITWHIPDVVLNERRFQMRKKGAELLPSLMKIEKLLGHNLGITKEILEARIDEAISKSVKTYKLEIENIIIENVNWEEMIKCAAFRLPPFEDSSKEKGFRDALILETAMELISKSPSSASLCRVLLITNDKLLTEAFTLRAADKTNASALNSIEDLESLINILDSQIKEELINSISKSAAKLFFIAENADTLFYKENIRKEITTRFENEMNALPPNSAKRENSQWWISNPGFVKKDRQKIFWKTAITIDSTAYKFKYNYTPQYQRLASGLTGMAGLGISGLGLIPGYAGIGNIYGLPETDIPTGTNKSEPYETIQSSQEIVSTGKSKFEIIWSVTLTTKKILKTPKIESINFIETIWT